MMVGVPDKNKIDAAVLQTGLSAAARTAVTLGVFCAAAYCLIWLILAELMSTA
jgi:hypothetical protein